MASRGKKKTTMAKLNRETRLVERRIEKQARKDARKSEPEEEPQQLTAPPVDETLAEDMARVLAQLN
jgi:hypothetical protein